MSQLSRSEVLDELMELRGVTSAAFVSSDGELLESRAEGEHSLASVEAMLSSNLASSRVLAELLGAEVATQTMLEFGSGALLLTRLAETPEAPVNVVALTSVQDVGRVRFGLRRLLPQLVGSTSPDELPDELR